MEHFYFGAPMKFFEEINGIDERSAEFFPWALTSMMAQCNMTGWPMVVHDKLLCNVIDHRSWEEKSGEGVTSQWRITSPKQRAVCPQWQARSPNQFDLSKDRR